MDELLRQDIDLNEIRRRNIKETLLNLRRNSGFYKGYYRSCGFSPEDFRTMDDLVSIPFTTREMLEENSEAMACRPRSDWIEVCPTSGTSGRSIYFPMTAGDLDFFADLCRRGAEALSIDRNDTVQIMLTSDNLLQPSRVMTHMFEHYLGALTLRAGPVGHSRQIQLMRELKPTVIFGIPSYLLALGRSFGQYGFNPGEELNLKLVISTGSGIYHDRWEPTAEKREIQSLWQAPYYSILGSTELNTGLWECPAANGHHVPDDYYIAEIIDPSTLKPVKAGVQGELVLTCTGREAMPLVRYRTGDVASMEKDPCPCGRKSARIMAINGRLDQLIKVKGTTVFPGTVEEAVMAAEGVSTYFIEVMTGADGQDLLKITIDGGESVKDRVAQMVKNRTDITPEVVSSSAEKIELIRHGENRVKSRKFWDRRIK